MSGYDDAVEKLEQVRVGLGSGESGEALRGLEGGDGLDEPEKERGEMVIGKMGMKTQELAEEEQRYLVLEHGCVAGDGLAGELNADDQATPGIREAAQELEQEGGVDGHHPRQGLAVEVDVAVVEGADAVLLFGAVFDEVVKGDSMEEELRLVALGYGELVVFHLVEQRVPVVVGADGDELRQVRVRAGG